MWHLLAVLCKSCGNWIQVGCAKIKKVTNRHAIDLNVRNAMGITKIIEDQKEKLHDDMETVKEFSNLDDRINSGGGCEVAVTSSIIIG